MDQFYYKKQDSVSNAWDEEDKKRRELQQVETERMQNLGDTEESKNQPAKDPKQFTAGDNIKEVGDAVVGGLIDTVNSVGSLPKLFDKKFYEPDDPDDPYSFDAPWIIKKKPITETRWGSFIRGAIELGTGFVGTGKVVWGVKGLKGFATAAKATRAGRVGLGAIQGATYDAISNQSQKENLARTLIDINPSWSSALTPFATKEMMSPAMKSIYNIGEGLGIGAAFDIAFEAAGYGIKTYSTQFKKIKKKNQLQVDPVERALEKSADIDYGKVTQEVENGAKESYIKSKPKKAWKNLSKAERQGFMEQWAKANDIDWGRERNFSVRAKTQGRQSLDDSVEQLNQDINNGGPSPNPSYHQNGDVTDNQVISTTNNPVKAVRDQIQIKNDFSQRDGSPEGVIPPATQRRIEVGAPNLIMKEIDRIAEALGTSPAWLPLEKVSLEDMKELLTDIYKFISDSNHKRLIDIPAEDIEKFVKDPRFGSLKREPINKKDYLVLNHLQVRAVDVVLGQMTSEIRDLARASLSVKDKIDVYAPGSVMDSVFRKYAVITKLRKEASAVSSWSLREFGTAKEFEEYMVNVSKVAQNEVDTLKKVITSDPDGAIAEYFMHFAATSGKNKQLYSDLDAFFQRKLKGYRGADKVERNAIINELQTMGMSSILSGPKTPVRALVGTGLGTVMRPAATVVGALLDGNERVMQGAFQTLGAMVESRNEAWRKAVLDWKAYNSLEEGWRGFTQSKKDLEWNAMKEHFDKSGSQADQIAFHFADQLRELNRLPIFNYGPRIMQSMDTFFSQLIARGRLRQLAFDDVYTKAINDGRIVSDLDLDDLVKQAEVEFEGRVFTADGQISDEMAIFAANEAKLTEELTGIPKRLDRIFEDMPFLRPFFLFARTGVNALKMTSKYTPGLNRFLGENADIMTKQWDDPALLKYGIKSPEDLELAKSVMKGRVAIGYGVASTAAWMALTGSITGNGPPDRSLRNSMIQEGWQPRSIKIGGRYVSYEALEPFNTFLSMSADIVDAQGVMGDAWASNQFAKISYLFAQNVTNKSFLAGLLQLQDLLTSDGGDAPRVMANFANNQLPLAGMRNEIGKVLSPGMRELESGFWQSIGNRNLWADLFVDGEMLPYRYDVLNGKKIRDWDPMTRFINAILPLNLNLGTTPTRELLFRTGINLKQTFNTLSDGTSLENYPDLKSKYQFYLGRQNIEAQLEELFAKNPAYVESIKQVERDMASNHNYTPEGSLHGPAILAIINQAKKAAESMLRNDSTYKPLIGQLQQMHEYQRLAAEQRKSGDYKTSRELLQQVENIRKIIK